MLLALRVQLEASIDFADEELDADGEAALRRRLDAARAQLDALLAAAEQGRRLRDGLHAVIVGPPNAGKSSLLNALAGSDRAIVADLPGTTRDLLQETIRVDGVELTLVDTAGLREEGDAIEREGMRRARAELARADAALVVLDARSAARPRQRRSRACRRARDRMLHNKSDLLPAQARRPRARSWFPRARAPDSTRCTHACAPWPGSAGKRVQGARAARRCVAAPAALLDEAVDGLAAARPELAA